ncbi:hypothetical protein KAR91_19290 [Candidatus Pacearchaeota archaeon]|nr:hypothetical protein [Candidatus Pacearchaeota archaeon]
MKLDIEKGTKQTKRNYTTPKIRSHKVLERAALACDGSPFMNYLTNTKTGYGSCGYNDS